MIMDSQWISLRVGGGVNNKDHQNTAANENVDLTLKLGLPNSTDDNDQNQNQRFDFAPNMAPQGQANQNVHGQDHTQGMNSHTEMGHEGRLVVRGNNIGGQTFHNNTNNPLFVWPPPGMQPNHLHGFAGQFSGYSPAVPVYTNLYHPHTSFTMNTTHHMMPMPMPLPLPPAPRAMNDYTLIDHIPMRRVDYVPRSSGAGGSRRRSGMRQQTNLDPDRRCTNYNCNTNNTPMWRNGPLGPKTLCNACGIKYRKEEDRKKANEAASSSRSHGQESNN